MVCVPSAGPRIIWQQDTAYHRLQVTQGEDARYLYFDRTLQSAMTLNDPTALRLMYTRYATLGSAFRPDARKMLMVGLGGGSIPKKLIREFPDLEIDAVELDAAVIEVAQEYFHVCEGRNLHLHALDGRRFIARTGNLYEIILIDAYSGEAMPCDLTTRECMALAHSRLTPGGILVANLVGAVTGPQSRTVRAFALTLGQVFPQIYVFAARRSDLVSTNAIQNVIVVATRESRRLTITDIVARASGLGRGLFPDRLEDIAAAYVDAPLDKDAPISGS